MKAPASLPIFGDAYLADTQHLTLEEHGAYFKLLLCAWRTSACELPLDDKRIATMLGVSAGKWGKLKPAVLAFWTLTATGWHQKRLTKERKFVDEKRAKNSLAAEARWEAKPLETNDGDDANANANAMPLSPTHLSEKKEPIADAMDGGPSIEADDGVEPIDLKAILFGTGVKYLTRNGTPERNARSMLGKWRKDYGDGAVVDALHLAQSEACSDPIPMITKILERKNGNANHGNSGRLGGGDKPHAAQRRNPAMDMLRDAIGGLDGLAGSPEADTGAPGGYRGTRLALSSGQLG